MADLVQVRNGLEGFFNVIFCLVLGLEIIPKRISREFRDTLCIKIKQLQITAAHQS